MPNNIRGSVFNLCSATLGAGALSLPFAFAQSGIAAGVVFLLIAAAATILSIRLLILSENTSNFKSFEALAVGLFGKWMGAIVEANIIIFSFGTAVAYCRAVGDILNPVVEMLDQSWMTDKLIMAFFWFVVMLPLSMLKHTNSLRFSSFFGVMTICYLVAATVAHAFDDLNFVTEVPWKSRWLWASSSFSGPMQAAPIIIFAFSCQLNVFEIYNELEKPTDKRMAKVTNLAMSICLAVYTLMGFFGFVNFQGETCGNILQNFRADIEETSPLIVAAYICITITILMAFPLVIFPCRFSIETAMNDIFSKHLKCLGHDSNIRHVLLTLLISGTSLLLSMSVPSISIVFQFLGGTTSAFLCFVLPAMFALRLKLYANSLAGRMSVWLLLIGGVVVGLFSTAVTVYGTVVGAGTKC